jgi:hypothetical protein
MSQSDNRFELPPTVNKDDGSPRMVGFELEFSGITLDETVTALQSALGGSLRSETVAERVLHVAALGDFNIELDWAYLKRKAAENESDEDWLERLGQAAALLVPVEVVCPPIPITELGVLIPLVAALREAGAVGTEESLLAAYGVHINTEIPALDAKTLFAYLRAFTLLQWWLVDAHEVDVTRKVSSYIDLYPEAYLKQLLSRSVPSLDTIFVDYLQHNASRNRALDLLPLLAEIDDKRVRRVVDDPKIKARPTFHYRLPNCHIERPEWSLSGPWNTWLVIERLAERKQDLNELSRAFLDAERPILGVNRGDWVDFMDRWLQDRELA